MQLLWITNKPVQLYTHNTYSAVTKLTESECMEEYQSIWNDDNSNPQENDYQKNGIRYRM